MANAATSLAPGVFEESVAEAAVSDLGCPGVGGIAAASADSEANDDKIPAEYAARKLFTMLDESPWLVPPQRRPPLQRGPAEAQLLVSTGKHRGKPQEGVYYKHNNS